MVKNLNGILQCMPLRGHPHLLILVRMRLYDEERSICDAAISILPLKKGRKRSKRQDKSII